eukprot:6375099-Alexandrium_andersonii.AAC.1
MWLRTQRKCTRIPLVFALKGGRDPPKAELALVGLKGWRRWASMTVHSVTGAHDTCTVRHIFTQRRVNSRCAKPRARKVC